MKRLLIIALLTLAWGARAQTFEGKYGTKLVLAGNGTDITNKLTLQAPSLGSALTWTLPSSNGTNGYALTTNGSGSLLWSQINLTLGVTGTLPIANGGTGQTTATGALNALLPDSTGNTSKYLQVTAGGGFGWATASGGGGGLTNWTEAVNTSSPNATVPVVSFTATNAATNVDAVLSPKGTGGFALQVADGTATGGNKRGNRAVDLQLLRTNATSVASGQWSFAVGYDNTASSYADIAMGYQNTANVSFCTAIGYSCTASNDYALATGYTTTASGLGSFASGYQSAATGDFASALCRNTTAAGGSSLSCGQYATANGFAQFATGQYNTLLPSSASGSFTATDPLFIIGNGTGSTQAARSYSAYITGDANFVLGGRKTTSDATGSQSATGIIQLGYANNTTFAKLTSASQASTRTYTIPDAGADANIVLTEGSQTINGIKTIGGYKLATQALSLTSGVTNNDVALTTSKNFYTVSGAGSGTGISGFAGGSDGQVITIANMGANGLSFSIADAGSSVGNRILGNGGIGITVNQYGTITLIYSSTANGWIIKCKS